MSRRSAERRLGRAEPASEPAPLQSDMRHGLASTVAGLGLYGALLLCLVALA